MKPSKEALFTFLKRVDNDFYPPLSEKTNLALYVDKILDKAILFCDLTDSGTIKGLIVVYANDYARKYAYIPLVCVDPFYRNQGIAGNLLAEAIQYLKSLKGKIQILGIHSNNPIAIKLYKDFGFHVVDSTERAYLELKL